MKIHPTLLVAALTALTAAPTVAQDPETAAATATVAKTNQFVLEAGKLSIENLIANASRFLKVNILIDPRECSGTQPMELHHSISTDREGCQEVLANILYRNGFALTMLDEKHDIYEAILMSGTRGREVFSRAEQKTVDQIMARPRLCVPVMTSVKLKHINAQLANNSLRPFFASTGGHQAAMSLSIGNVGNQSALILAGMQNQVAQAIELIRRCDVAGEPQPGERIMQEKIAELTKRVASLEKQLMMLTGKRK